ncbi:TSUP family transporter [Streptomyces odontomachi]|uniref:TSUP family transporter n=1 Tax=Streptomyces odontomachi TaxID=2944940 RepID=UPI00210AD508|nr:TSUP family transporter [Streptomyces sp. ODS25]
MTAGTVVPVLLGVLVGAGTQRVTGLGFTLVAGPLLTLLLGPVEGVRLANVLSLLSSLLILPFVWRDVAPRRVLRLVVPALLVLPAGAWLAARVPASPLLVAEGALVLAALYGLHRFSRPGWLRGRAGTAAAGAASGLMNVTAGIGGPAVTLYATATDWEQRSFVAGMQLYTILLNTGSLVAKGPLDLPVHVIALSAVAALAGTGIGQLASHRVSARRARQAVQVAACAGAVGAIVKGVITL